jgi:hypothetical protein
MNALLNWLIETRCLLRNPETFKAPHKVFCATCHAHLATVDTWGGKLKIWLRSRNMPYNATDERFVEYFCNEHCRALHSTDQKPTEQSQRP